MIGAVCGIGVAILVFVVWLIEDSQDRDLIIGMETEMMRLRDEISHLKDQVRRRDQLITDHLVQMGQVCEQPGQLIDHQA